MSLINKEPFITPEMISKWNAGESGWTLVKTITKAKTDFTQTMYNGDVKRCQVDDQTADFRSALVNASEIKVVGYFCGTTGSGGNSQIFGEVEGSYSKLAELCPNGNKIINCVNIFYFPSSQGFHYLSASTYIYPAEVTAYLDMSVSRYDAMDSSGRFVVEYYVK